ncbi:MAG: hypothetical protein WB424_04100 [Terracidiphilus sp.]
MRTVLLCALLTFASFAYGQVPTLKPPCEFSGDLLRNDAGKPVLFSSEEMKQRATHKIDLVGLIKQLDFRSTMIVEVLVGTSGDVICTKTLSGISLARKPVEDALRQWKFKPVEKSGKSIAYLGQIDFILCNMDCGDEGFGITLLK